MIHFNINIWHRGDRNKIHQILFWNFQHFSHSKQWCIDIRKEKKSVFRIKMRTLPLLNSLNKFTLNATYLTPSRIKMFSSDTSGVILCTSSSYQWMQWKSYVLCKILIQYTYTTTYLYYVSRYMERIRWIRFMFMFSYIYKL